MKKIVRILYYVRRIVLSLVIVPNVQLNSAVELFFRCPVYPVEDLDVAVEI